MAFNFNWSPLTADASFYTRAQELLTAAINKSPKPPIIVDDILVNQLNPGSVPPDLEILEIGDLAEDRFRGIFKMCYSGDAFLTLKTRVQANPLNTYLSTKPSFTSPQPLAAASGLTIPIQITLSDIRLSAFIILVFSKQKGLTLVFRNDPLESLKVSSTFDSIPFVRDYLQKEIERQLRTLLMDEVPAIIHRLSLRLWVPEYRARQDEELSKNARNMIVEEKVIDPLACPPADPIDPSGYVLDASQLTLLSLDSNPERRSLFSQKNLLRLGALSETHRTLSLSTPTIRDAVFRAWAGPTERGEYGSHPPVTPLRPSLSRGNSYLGNTSTTYTFSDSSGIGNHLVRPSLSNFGSSASGLSLGTTRHGKSHGGRKRKHRIINLRKKAVGAENDTGVESGEGSTVSGTTSSAPSEFGAAAPLAVDRDGELLTPPRTPEKSSPKFDACNPDSRMGNLVSSDVSAGEDLESTPRPPALRPSSDRWPSSVPLASSESPKPDAAASLPQIQLAREKSESTPSSSTSRALSAAHPQHSSPQTLYPEAVAAAIPEHALMMKIVGEITRRLHEEKLANSGFWERSERDENPPPAYGS